MSSQQNFKKYHNVCYLVQIYTVVDKTEKQEPYKKHMQHWFIITRWRKCRFQQAKHVYYDFF